MHAPSRIDISEAEHKNMVQMSALYSHRRSLAAFEMRLKAALLKNNSNAAEQAMVICQKVEVEAWHIFVNNPNANLVETVTGLLRDRDIFKDLPLKTQELLFARIIGKMSRQIRELKDQAMSLKDKPAQSQASQIGLPLQRSKLTAIWESAEPQASLT